MSNKKFTYCSWPGNYSALKGKSFFLLGVIVFYKIMKSFNMLKHYFLR